jgi:methylenetetrahydrofolate reductase (NADPH)
MTIGKEKRQILVISQLPHLLDAVRASVAGTIAVEYADNAAEGLGKLREILPDLIVLGNLDSPEAVARLTRNLRDGWISHHAALLIIDYRAAEDTYRILNEETIVSGAGGSFPLSQPAALFLPKLREAIDQKLKSRESRLKKTMLDPGCFCLVWEQIPGPGAFEMRQEIVLDNARMAARSGAVHAISITDNPGGNPAIATDILCAEIRRIGIEPLVHIAFRDRSRNQAESLLFQLAALDINNVLILTGDYPSNLGFTGRSKPVFDLDSVNGLRLVAEMNRGLERDIMRKPIRLAPTDFYAGVAFSPFKQMEAEVMGQFFKMQKKVEAGADFAITQIGYDARKLHEFQVWLRTRGYKIPVLAGIYVLSYPVAKAMRENNIPGCVVTEKLLNRIAAESEAKDKGKQARLERAAKMYAIVKGMGYKGAYISGQGLAYDSLEYIVARGNDLAGRWMDFLPEFEFPQENGFYYFEKNPATGLNAETPAQKPQKPVQPLLFKLSRLIHSLVFEPGALLFKVVQKTMQFINSSPVLYRVLHFFERGSKTALYCCKDCGDCALFDTAYLCPVSQCPKDQRNAPCGGSYQGWCEVYPGEQQCIWVQAYLRLKALHREEEIGQFILPPCNWELWQTSSWVNYFLGRDHSSKRRNIVPPGKKLQD